MAALNSEVKSAIVTRLACGEGYSDVARSVSADHGISITRFQVRTYDPSSMGYAAGEKWRPMFDASRKSYLERVAVIPIADKAYRLEVLQNLLETAMDGREYVLALNALKLASKETADDHASEVATPSLSVDERRAMVADLIGKLMPPKPASPTIDPTASGLPTATAG